MKDATVKEEHGRGAPSSVFQGSPPARRMWALLTTGVDGSRRWKLPAVMGPLRVPGEGVW